MLPTPGTIAMFERWTSLAPELIKSNEHDQQGLDKLAFKAWRRCTGAKACRLERANVRCMRHRSCVEPPHSCPQLLDDAADLLYCNTPAPQLKADNISETTALLRAFQPGYYPYIDDICTLSRPHIAPLFDLCDWSCGCWRRVHAACADMERTSASQPQVPHACSVLPAPAVHRLRRQA